MLSKVPDIIPIAYTIWRERNHHRHGENPSTTIRLIKHIDNGVRNRLQVQPTNASSRVPNILKISNTRLVPTTFPTIPPKGIQRPNRRDVKSVVAKTRTRVAGSTAVPPLPPNVYSFTTVVTYVYGKLVVLLIIQLIENDIEELKQSTIKVVDANMFETLEPKSGLQTASSLIHKYRPPMSKLSIDVYIRHISYAMAKKMKYLE
ncbi:hypothetical protein YC2023_070979 [Brassica napus]